MRLWERVGIPLLGRQGDVLKEREEKASKVGDDASKVDEVKERPTEEAVREGLAPPPKKTWKEMLFGAEERDRSASCIARGEG